MSQRILIVCTNKIAGIGLTVGQQSRDDGSLTIGCANDQAAVILHRHHQRAAVTYGMMNLHGS